MKKSLYIFTFLCLFTGMFTGRAQTVIAFQGFEGAPADNWAFTPPSQNPTAPMVTVGAGNYGPGYASTGNNSIRVGGGSTACGTGSANCINGSAGGGSCTNNFNGAIVEFAPVNVQCYTGVTISAAHRTHEQCGGQGQGLDGSDQLFFEVSLDGGTWASAASITGSLNCVWTYTTTGVSCNGDPAVANPFVYNVPAGTQSVAFRVRVQRNRADEVFYLDDVTISGTPTPLPPLAIQHINAPQYVTVSPDSVCAGDQDILYRVPPPGGVSPTVYTWSVTGAGTATVLAPPVNDSILVDWPNTVGTDTVKVFQSNGGGCVGPTIALPVVRYQPTATLAGNATTICTGSAVNGNYNVTFTGRPPFSLIYQFTDGVNTIGPVTVNNITTYNYTINIPAVMNAGNYVGSIISANDRGCPISSVNGHPTLTVITQPPTPSINHIID